LIECKPKEQASDKIQDDLAANVGWRAPVPLQTASLNELILLQVRCCVFVVWQSVIVQCSLVEGSDFPLNSRIFNGFLPDSCPVFPVSVMKFSQYITQENNSLHIEHVHTQSRSRSIGLVQDVSIVELTPSSSFIHSAGLALAGHLVAPLLSR
jgi:hypothetical protein